MPEITNIDLGDELELFVENQVQSGRYTSASEVVSAGLRHLRDEETKISALRTAVREGIESGPAEPFNFDEFIASYQNKH